MLLISATAPSVLDTAESAMVYSRIACIRARVAAHDLHRAASKTYWRIAKSREALLRLTNSLDGSASRFPRR
jgi:hypothetical protein